MATSDAKTALLSEAAGNAASTATTKASKKLDDYELKKGHVDTKEEHDKLDDVLYGVDDQGLRWSIIFLDRLSKIIISVFTCTAMACAAAAVLAFFGLFGGEWIWTPVILIITNGGAILGAYGVYKYGALQEYLNQFEEENKKYESNIDELQLTSVELKKDVHGISESVDKMKVDADELNNTLGQYDEIREELAKLCGEDGDMKEVNDMVDSMNDGYASMQKIVINNKKAALLATYYDVSTRDGDDGLSEKEYKRFLGKLTVEQRGKFQEKGTFQEIAGKDGVIDLREFQELVDDIIAECDEELMNIMSDK